MKNRKLLSLLVSIAMAGNLFGTVAVQAADSPAPAAQTVQTDPATAETAAPTATPTPTPEPSASAAPGPEAPGANTLPQAQEISTGETALLFNAGNELKNAGDFNVIGEDENGWNYDSDAKTLTFKEGEGRDYTITGNSRLSTEKIVVNDGFSGKITIEGLSINVSAGLTFTSAFSVSGGATLELVLSGINALYSDGSTRAGLEYADATEGHSLTISGDGSLEAFGAVGIGSYTGEANNITIKSGTVMAHGVSRAIGSASGSVSNIAISGGNVTAYAENENAAIGGASGQTNNIAISGGTVTTIGGSAPIVGEPQITGGSVKANGSITARDANGNELAPATFPWTGNALPQITVDGADSTLDGYHKEFYGGPGDDTNYYLYLTKDTAHIVQAGEKAYLAKWENDAFAVTELSASELSGPFYVTGTPANGWKYIGGVLAFTENGTYTVIGVTPTKDNRIVINSVAASITLQNVNIDLSNSSNVSAFSVSSAANLTLDLRGSNALKSGDERAGLEVNEGNTLTLKSTTGTGKLTAVGGGEGSGIGSRESQNFGAITINSGIITATSAAGAGIGGASSSDENAKVTIHGGNVTSIGGSIGVGNVADPAATVVIDGGTVTAGGGSGNGSLGSIPTINGGSVKMEYPSASVGGNLALCKLDGMDRVDEITVDKGAAGEKTYTRQGNHSNYDATYDDTAFYLYLTPAAHTLTLPDGTVYTAVYNTTTNTFDVKNAGAFNVSPADGGWKYDPTANTLTFAAGTDKNYTITGDHSYTCGERIFVENGFTGTITIDGVNIAVDYRWDHELCPFSVQTGANLTLDLRGENTLQSGDSSAALLVNEGSSLTIQSTTATGKLTAGVESGGAGIGAVRVGVAGPITIKSGIIVAIGGDHGVGIGSTYRINGITIEGGTVYAAGGTVGIGGNDAYLGRGVIVRGGNVTAIGDEYIGLGTQYDLDTIDTISGGTVTVGGNAPPFSTESAINITGGSVKVNKAITAKNNGADLALATVPGVAGDTVTVDGTAYTRDGSHYDETSTGTDKYTDTAFYLYLTKQTHYITVGETVYKAAWDEDAGKFTVAVSENNAGDFKVTGGTAGKEWAYSPTDNTLTFNTSGTYTVTGDHTYTSKERILVADNFDGKITINGVHIDTGADTCAFSVSGIATLELALAGTNTLVSGPGHAGLEYMNADATHSLTISGDGTLNASGGVGIGAYDADANNITINSGTVTATGYMGAIGAYNADANNLAITGGTVYAKGHFFAIGSEWGDTSNITISGGNVTTNSESGVAIGGDVGKTTNITISAGTVTARGGSASIAGEPQITGGSVKVNNPITAKNGTESLALAELTGLADDVNQVTVDGVDYTRDGNHYATTETYDDSNFYLYLPTGTDHVLKADGKAYLAKWENSAFTVRELDESELCGPFYVTGKNKGGWTYESGVLSFHIPSTYTVIGLEPTTSDRIEVSTPDSDAGAELNITLQNVDIDLSNRDNASAFSVPSEINLTLDLRGNNTLKSGDGRAGLEVPEYATLTLKSTTGTGKLTAVGGGNGAGIGSSESQNFGAITIESGSITATSALGAGIGSGSGAPAADKFITITGGTVYAKGGAVGIGDVSDGNHVSITGGNVTGIGDKIGIGCVRGVNTVSIDGGTVTAGGGSLGSGPIINGGSVKMEHPSLPGNGDLALYKLENQDGVDEVTVDGNTEKKATYTRQGNHSEYNTNYTDNAFYLYLTKENHTLTAGTDTYDLLWDGEKFQLRNAGDFLVTGENTDGEWDYDQNSNTLTFRKPGNFTITGNPDYESQECIMVWSTFTGTLTINGVNIDVSNTTNDCAFFVSASAQLTLDLAGKNTLKSGPGRSGLEYQGEYEPTGTLTIQSTTGTGTLSATGGQGGAGIGGIGEDINNITITGGIIRAEGKQGVGIGNADGRLKNITITGGDVTAIGNGKTGIGAEFAVEKIEITGGTVHATGINAPAIGSMGSVGGMTGAGGITIGGGSVTAASTGDYPAIGGMGNVTRIEIMGGTVNATSENGPAIGGMGNVTRIEIMGDTVNATSANAPAIGSMDSVGSISISGNANANVTAESKGAYPAIGGVELVQNIYIGGGTVKATSNNGPAIGSVGEVEIIDITGGNVTANTVGAALAIGSATSSTSSVRIRDATVTAADGIKADNVRIYGGSVKGTVTDINTGAPTDGAIPLSLAKLTGQEGVNTVTVDGVDYTRQGNHMNDEDTAYTDGTFYLYLSKEDHTIVVGSGAEQKTYRALWQDDEFTVLPAAPAPVIETTQTAHSITVVPPLTDYGVLDYIIEYPDGTTSSFTDSLTFEYLSANTPYTIYASYSSNETWGYSDEATKVITTNTATYTISIPKQATAGGDEVEIKATALDLGKDGSVKVTADAPSVDLRDTQHPGDALTSALYIGGQPATGTLPLVGNFTAINQSVSILFAEPTFANGTIPAGNYSGTMVFTIDYQEGSA